MKSARWESHLKLLRSEESLYVRGQYSAASVPVFIKNFNEGSGISFEQSSITLCFCKDLNATGAGKPAGRLYHVATEQPIGMLITDIWESEEKLNKFSETLLPILKKNGVTPVPPTLLHVHNIIS